MFEAVGPRLGNFLDLKSVRLAGTGAAGRGLSTSGTADLMVRAKGIRTPTTSVTGT